MELNLFIKRVTKFSAVLVLFIFVSFLISKYLLNFRNNIFEIKASTKTLIIGDSQIEYSLDDSIIENSLNISSAADIYLYSYVKLKAFAERNKSVKTVILGLSYHNLLKSLEEEWMTDSYIMNKMFKYSFLLNIHEYFDILREYPVPFIKSLNLIYKSVIKNFLKSFLVGRYTNYNLGKFIPLHKDNIDVALTWRIQPREIEYSKLQIKYFNKIVEYCKDNNINIILLTAPLHPIYIQNKTIEKKALDNYISKNIGDINYLDFSKFVFPDNKYFADTWHLNYRGAALFSEKLNIILNSPSF